ncbi:MAG: indolepyruvate ferredoxin oxidoreductase subunit alpha, partial [Planctomycetes bacterium]|nr:indolepyruvate ferredoxin oxidoreductase subunit alpha [Planctomycetota bacterium]
TEILEAAVQHKDEIYCEWAPNEKVALEVAAGASLAGARSIVTMKHVGLNVAADPLMTFAYIGTVGGCVICVADDPGMHSSQNEQDTRHYARLAKIPVLEPSDSQEACDFVSLAMELSEKYRTPVILRSTTRVSHSRSIVELKDRGTSNLSIGFEKNPQRFVPIPVWGRRMHTEVEERLLTLAKVAASSAANRMEIRDRTFGIIASGIAYQYVREVFPDASVLKLGWSYPFPDKLFLEFAGQVEKILVVEELDNFVEEHVRSLGIACEGKKYMPVTGELSATVLEKVRNRIEGKEPEAEAAKNFKSQTDDLPARPPILCPGCPHRGIFHSLGKFDVIVTGDIGCYSLGVFSPLERIDTILCMGGGFTVAHGMEKAGEKRKVVGIVGDSTFFHSGITGLLEVAYNRGVSTFIVVDNRTTAMTGHQEHPGTGITLMGEKTSEASIEAIGKACGIKNVATVYPYDLQTTHEIMKTAIASDEAWLIISKAPCPLRERKPVGVKNRLEARLCRDCGLCLKLGCPAIEKDNKGVISINPLLCAGCGLCKSICPANAFFPLEESSNE